VLERVGEGFLRDPVRGEVEGRGKWRRFSFHTEFDGQAGFPDVREKLSEVRKARLRREQCAVAVSPEHTKEPPHLVDGVASGGLDRLQRRQP
jgi:hypothetical protein